MGQSATDLSMKLTAVLADEGVRLHVMLDAVNLQDVGEAYLGFSASMWEELTAYARGEKPPESNEQLQSWGPDSRCGLYYWSLGDSVAIRALPVSDDPQVTLMVPRTAFIEFCEQINGGDLDIDGLAEV